MKEHQQQLLDYFQQLEKQLHLAAIIATLTALFSRTKAQICFFHISLCISVLSMFYGSIVAIAQNNIKRMLAYSSISHAGYILQLD
ncbi:MAG: hypothetical protein MZV64_47600 [Ignavibacteriales bacterium]|nr:hypothetical protein [Ignavibacteriales bacterium]